jgi:hypothetical protein
MRIAMNEHPDVETVEKFAIDPSAIPGAEAECLRAHFESCSSCSELLVEMTAYYEDVKNLSDPDISEAETRLIRRARLPVENREPRIFRLSPEIRTATIGHARPPVLALAAQESTVRQRFLHCGTLTTTDESTLIRVMKDNEQGTYFFQVLSDSPDCAARVLVTFDGIAGEFVTDGHGEASLGAIPDPSVRELRAYVHPAVDVFHVSDEDLDGLRSSGSAILTGSNGSRLRIKALSESPRLQVEIVAPDNGSGPSIASILFLVENHSAFLQLKDNETSFDASIMTAGTEIRVYS